MLTEDNILLRRLDHSDIPQIALLANNINIWNNVRDLLPHPYSEKDAEEFIISTEKEDPEVTFGIEYNKQLCGAIGLVPQMDVYKKSAEIGYWIGEPYWGKGIATKAVELILKYGFETLHLIRVYSGVFEGNAFSMRVLEKNGFKKEGVFKKAIFKNGKILDEHRYAIIKA